MSKRELLRVAHTLLALLIGMAPFVPELVARLGVPTTAGAGATVIAVSVAITKAMNIPAVHDRLVSWVNK